MGITDKEILELAGKENAILNIDVGNFQMTSDNWKFKVDKKENLIKCYNGFNQSNSILLRASQIKSIEVNSEYYNNVVTKIVELYEEIEMAALDGEMDKVVRGSRETTDKIIRAIATSRSVEFSEEDPYPLVARKLGFSEMGNVLDLAIKIFNLEQQYLFSRDHDIHKYDKCIIPMVGALSLLVKLFEISEDRRSEVMDIF